LVAEIGDAALGVDRLAVAEGVVHPEQGGREQDAGLLEGGGLVDHLRVRDRREEEGAGVFWCEEMRWEREKSVFLVVVVATHISHLRAAGAEGAAKPFIVRWADEEDLCGERERAKERW